MKIGDKVKLSEEGRQNENYKDFQDKILVIDRIDRNIQDNPLYDEGLEGEALYSFEFEDGATCPFSLYDFEIEGIKK